MSKSGGTLYIGVPHSKFWGTCPSVPQGLRLCLGYVSFAANSFRRTEVKCVRKKTCTLARFDDNVAVVATTVASITTGIFPVSGKITPAEVAGLSWGLVCVPGCVRGASASGGSGRGSCASGGDSRSLSTSVSPLASSNDRSRALRTPQANVAFPNANIESVTERSR